MCKMSLQVEGAQRDQIDQRIQQIEMEIDEADSSR